jgi:hypothetical protein
MEAGGSEIVDRAGLGVRDPEREHVRGEHRLDVAAAAVGLAGVPQVDDLAFQADRRLFAPVAGHDLPIQDHMRTALPLGPLQRLVQVRSLFGEHGDQLVQVATPSAPGGRWQATALSTNLTGSSAGRPPNCSTS